MIEEDLEIEDIDDESYYLRELSKLEKKLEIATKALKEYADKDKWEHCSPDWRDAEKALKEMECVK